MSTNYFYGLCGNRDPYLNQNLLTKEYNNKTNSTDDIPKRDENENKVERETSTNEKIQPNNEKMEILDNANNAIALKQLQKKATVENGEMDKDKESKKKIINGIFNIYDKHFRNFISKKKSILKHFF